MDKLLEGIEEAKKLLQDIDKKSEKLYIDLIKKKFDPVPKDWTMIFPIEYEHHVPALFKDRVRFVEYIKDVYILNNDPFNARMDNFYKGPLGIPYTT